MRILMVIVTAAVSVAHAAVLADTSVEQRLRSVLGEALPGIEIASIRPAPLKGMHEVVLGGEVYIVSDNGRFILKGDLMDLKDKRNISDERRAEARIAGLTAVPPNTMIDFAPPDTQHVLYVYTASIAATAVNSTRKSGPRTRRVRGPVSRVSARGRRFGILQEMRNGLVCCGQKSGLDRGQSR